MSIVNKILKEAAQTNHFNQRLHSRFLDKPYLEVGYEDGTNNYVTVGSWELPESEKTIIKDDISFLESVTFDIKKSYAIRFSKIRINMNDINFYSDEKKQLALHKQLIVVDDEHSYGDIIYAIVEENKLISTYFVRSYAGYNFRTDVKLNLDAIKQHLSNKRKVTT